jgi:hypothetical protein
MTTTTLAAAWMRIDELERRLRETQAAATEIGEVVAQLVDAVAELDRRTARRGPRDSHRDFMAQRAARRSGAEGE